jgi:tetratricopeptide (TPR) repeat protein
MNLDWVPDWSVSPVLAGLAVWLGWSCYQQFKAGEMTLPRGGGTYSRSQQPRMFWFATVVMALHLLLAAFGSAFLAYNAIQTRILASCDVESRGDAAHFRAIAKQCDASVHSIWASRSTRQLLHDNKAFALHMVGDHQAAIEELSKAIAIAPEDQWAFYMRGLSHARAGKLKDAATDLDVASKLEPDNWDTLRERASVNIQIGQASKAIADLDRLVAIRPKDETLVRMLSIAHAAKENCDLALSLADKALALGDKTVWPYRSKGLCFGKMGRLDEAANAYGEAIRLDPRDLASLLARAGIEFRDEKYDAAIDDVSRAIELSPQNPILRYQRCEFRALANRQLEAALSDCNSAADSGPDALMALEGRAMVRYRLEQYAAAAADATRLLEKYPNSATVLYIRGLARKKLGNPAGDRDIALARERNLGDVVSLAGFGFTP